MYKAKIVKLYSNGKCGFVQLMLVPQEAGDSDIAVTSHDTCDTPPPLPPPPPPDAELITGITNSHVL